MTVLTMPMWRKHKASIGQNFEFHIFDENAEPVNCAVEFVKDVGLARAKAGRLAKKNGGPVDLAYCGNAEWADRYVTTAMPSEFHASGFRFERLGG